MRAWPIGFVVIGICLVSWAFSPRPTAAGEMYSVAPYTFEISRGNHSLWIAAQPQYGYVLVIASWNIPALGPRLEQIEGVQQASTWLPIRVHAEILGFHFSTWVLGVDPVLPGEVENGHFFTGAELEQGAAVCLLESSLLSRLPVDQPQDLLGKEVAVRIDQSGKSLILRVVGTYTRVPMDGLYNRMVSSRFRTMRQFLMDGGEGFVVPYNLSARLVRESGQTSFVSVDPSMATSRVAEAIGTAFSTGDLNRLGSMQLPASMPRTSTGAESTGTAPAGAEWLDRLPKGLLILVFLALILGVLPYSLHLGFRWIVRQLTRKYGPTFPHDAMEVITLTLMILYAIGAAFMGLALFFAQPSQVPDTHNPFAMPISKLAKPLEESPLTRVYYVAIRVLGAVVFTSSLGVLAYAFRQRLAVGFRFAISKARQWLEVLLLTLVALLAGFLLSINGLPGSPIAVSQSKGEYQIIHIYKPTYGEFLSRNPGLRPIAVPVGQSAAEQPLPFHTADLAEIKSATSGIEYLYAFRTLPVSWQGQEAQVVEATADYWAFTRWQLLAGTLPRNSGEVLMNAGPPGIDNSQKAREWVGKVIAVEARGLVEHWTVVGLASAGSDTGTPTFYRLAPEETTWTSATAITSPDTDPVSMAAALQQTLDERYGRNEWRAESRLERLHHWHTVANRVRAASIWVTFITLLLAIIAAFSISIRRFAYAPVIGVSGGLLGSFVGRLTLPWLSPLVFAAAGVEAQQPGLLVILFAAAAVGGAFLLGGSWRAWRRLRPALSTFVPALLLLAFGVGLVSSFASIEETVRHVLATAAQYRYVQLFRDTTSSEPSGWTREDIDKLRPYLSEGHALLALSTGNEAYVRDLRTKAVYSALVLAGSEDLPVVRGWTVVAGRTVTAQDIAGRARVAVIARDFARLLWGEETPREYVGKSLEVRFAAGARPEWQQFTVVGVIDTSPAFLRAVSDASYLPALCVPLGMSPASTLPDGPALGRYLEARSATGESDRLLSDLAKLAPAYLHPTYGYVTYRKYDPLAAAAQSFGARRRALAVQVLVLVAIAGVAFLALRSPNLLARTDPRQAPSESSGWRFGPGRGIAATSIIFLVGGCLLGIVVALLLAPHLMFPYLVHSVFLTVETATLPFLTPAGVVKGILAAIVAVGIVSTCSVYGSRKPARASTPPA